jgi:hypothetical protein
MSADASGLELVLRVIGVTELTVVACVFFRARRSDHLGWIGAGLCLSIAAFLITSTHGARTELGVLVYPVSAICSTHPVWFWLFCAALFGDRPRLSRAHVICIATMGAAGLLYWLTLPDQPWFRDPFGMALGLAGRERWSA